MEHVLTIGSVVPAALGAGCCVVDRRAGWSATGAMILMVVAMTDTMIVGGAMMPAIAWSGVMILVAIVLTVAQMDTPRALDAAQHLGMMALLTAAMAVSHPAHDAGGSRSMQHAHLEPAQSATGIHVFVGLAVLVGVAGAVVLLAQARRCATLMEPVGRLNCTERTLTATSLLAMSSMVLFA